MIRKALRQRRREPLLEMPAGFAGCPASAQREHVEWALEAKRSVTRARRIATTVEQCAEGKRRYWAMAGR